MNPTRLRSRRRVAAAVSAVAIVGLLASCGTSEDEGSGITTTTETTAFTKTGGCADAVFYAMTEDETMAITVSVDVRDRDAAVDETIAGDGGTLPAEVELLEGTALRAGFCNDVITMDHEITERTALTSYSGRVRVDAPIDADSNGHVSGSVSLDQVALPDGTELLPIEMETDLIGFLAG